MSPVLWMVLLLVITAVFGLAASAPGAAGAPEIVFYLCLGLAAISVLLGRRAPA